MILLQLQLTLQNQRRYPAVAASPFLGSVLHGALEGLVRQHAPAIAADLGIGSENQLKRYAIMPPKYGWKVPITNESIVMQCGVILHGHARQHAQAVIDALRQWREIGLADRIDHILHLDVQCFVPGPFPPQRICLPQNNYLSRPPDFETVHCDRDCVTLRFFTPFKLRSTHRLLTDSNAMPPGLLQHVRSLTDKVVNVEPDLAAALGIGSLEWVVAVEQIRHLRAAWHQLQPVQWHHGSSNHKKPFLFKGLLGSVHYAGRIPAVIIALLHWGIWLGIGEGTALGRGMYNIQEPLTGSGASVAG